MLIAWLVLIASITAPTTKMKKKMFDNLMRRFTIWLGRQDIIFRYLGWDHKRVHRKRGKQWNFEGNDD